MSDLIPEIPDEVTSLDERIETLVRELELAIRWQRPCILLAVYSSEYVRADAETLLENQLIDLGQEIFHIQVKGTQNNLFQLLQESETSKALVFFVEGLRWGQSEGQSIYASLDSRKEYFKENAIRAVFWLTENEYTDLAHGAPDFWGLRHQVVEFAESPTPDQVMQQALEAAWQSTGEYAGQYDDTDEQILFRESLLMGIPKAEEASALRANILLTLGLLNWRKGDFEKADGQLQEALNIAAVIQNPWFEAECFNGTALVKTSLERIDEAIDAYKQAIRLAPEQVFAWNNLGNLCTKIGRNDEAIVAFMKAVECNPQDPIAWNGLGTVYNGIGYFDDAIAAFRRSICFMPSFAHPWNGLGDAYMSVGRSDDALKAYEKAIQLNSRFITPWLHLAELYAGQERHRDAIKAYQRALALDPRNAATWNELALIYVKSNALEDAEDAFSKAIDIDCSYGWAYGNLAMVYAAQERYGDSVPLYKRSVELLEEASEKAICWNRLGDVYRQMNDYDKAVAAYKMADSLKAGGPLLAVDGSIAQTSPRDTTEAEVQRFATPLPEPVGAPDLQEPARSPSPIITTVEEQPIPAAGQAVPEARYRILDHSPQPENSIEPGQSNLTVAPNSLTSQETGGTVMPMPYNLDPGKPGEGTISPLPDEPLQARNTGSANEDALAWNEKGNIHFKRGAYEDAINAYNKAIRLDPAFGWPYGNLALSYFAQGRPAEAILLYQKSIALLTSNQERAVSWNGLGNAYRLMHDYAAAMSAYQKAAELDPATAGMRDGAETPQEGPSAHTAEVWNDLGESFVKSGAYDQATNAFKKAISLDPNFGWPYSNLARILASQGKHAEAIPLYQKSIELLPEKKDKAVSWNRLGNTYRKLNDYDNAIKAFQEAVALTDEGMNLVTRTRFSLLSNCYAE